MAGEIQLNSTTMATESSGSITAELDTIRPNTTNGSLTLQGDSSGSGVTGLTIDSSGVVNTTTAKVTNIQATSGQSLTIKDEDGNAAITIGTDNTAAGYLSLNFGSYHGDSGGAGSGTLSANTLDDYETGSWTATLASGATTTPTGNGRYIKVGNVVHVSLNGVFATITVNGQAIEISGLPFTTSSNNVFNPTGTIGYLARAQYQASSHHFCDTLNSSTTVRFRYISANTGGSSALLSESSGNYTPNFAFQMTYLID